MDKLLISRKTTADGTNQVHQVIIIITQTSLNLDLEVINLMK